MKKLIAFALFLSLGLSVAMAQKTAPTTGAAKATSSGPSMTLETTEVDYGVIAQDSDPFRVFKFTNTGDAPLVIKDAKGSCGCTVPTYPKEPIMPGESSEIKVRYATDRIGVISKTITLTTNEETETRVLRIKGKVEPKPAEPAAVPTAPASILNGSGGN